MESSVTKHIIVNTVNSQQQKYCTRINLNTDMNVFWNFKYIKELRRCLIKMSYSVINYESITRYLHILPFQNHAIIDYEVISLSPTTLMATDRDLCMKLQRYKNIQLHLLTLVLHPSNSNNLQLKIHPRFKIHV